MQPQPRLAPLDVLRFFAISLVLVQHAPVERHAGQRFGWAGVDLFFVLSGFLVAGLLFGEREKRGRVDVVRFLVRRGFKIYPSFWALTAATVAFYRATGVPFRPLQLACELLFLQNYGPSLWVHTWSLAVEEHFYFVLAAAFALAQRRWPAPARPGRRALMGWGAAALAAILVSRCVTLLLVPERYKLVVRGTHVRIDGLIFGALLAALYHYEGPWLREATRRHRAALLGLTALGALPALALGFEHLYTRTLGFTFVYLFSGAILLTALFAEGPPGGRRPFAAALAYVGRHSYGIYLWHLLAGHLAQRLLSPEATGGPLGARLALYLVAAFVPGVVLSRLIEEPFLALRDRIFPRRA